MAGQARISGLNYDAVLGSEDYQAYRDAIENEIITRFKMGSGFPYQDARLGILDASNPAKITSSETGRPLFIQVSIQNSLGVSVNPGYAVAPNGSILNVPAFQNLITLAATPITGQSYVVLLEAIVDATAGSTQLNDYQVQLSSQQVVETLVHSIPYVAGYTPTETQVVLAVVTVVQSGLVQSLQIDQTQNIYSFVRPWFSIIDTQHRAHIGSGTVTDTNPHGTSINDLTTPGTVGLFQGLTGQGCVISESRLRNKMVGANICNEIIQFSQILTDATGTITVGSPYNKAGAMYVMLSKFPTRMGSIYSGTPANAISGEVIPGTNMLVFGPNENIVTDQVINVQYTSAQALQPPAVLTSNILNFTQPSTGEVIVAGNFNYPSIPDPTYSFEGSGPFARRYHLYLMPSGVFTSSPQVLVTAQSVFTSISGTFTPVVPAKISVGLTNTTGSALLDVQCTITGTVESETGAGPTIATEVLSFKASTGYVDQIVPSTSYDLPGQILCTANRYSQITTISFTASNAGVNPQIQVWAELEPGTCPDMNDACDVADVDWNGNAIKAVRDARVVRGQWSPEAEDLSTTAEAQLDAVRPTLATPVYRMFTDDFEDLAYFDSLWGFVDPTKATGVLGLNSSVSLQAGDTIQLTPTKTATAINGVPALPGQFNVGSNITPIPIATIVTNLITAINDPAFASQVVAAPSGSNPLNILLTLQSPVGVAANSIVISAIVFSPGAIAVSGWNFAADGYGECYLDRSVKGILCPVIPLNANLNPYQLPYRRRYRSRAYSLENSVGPKSGTFRVEVHGSKKPFTESVRIRGSFATNPQVWTAWAVMTAAPVGNKGLYTFSFSAPVHKIQVEYYGRARGVTAIIAT